MKLSINFFETVRDKVTVSSAVGKKVTLTKKGVEYGGLCPFHNEKTPSFTVNDIKRFYHCFGCAAHGDVIRFVAETSGMSYKEAAIKLAEENSIEIPKLSKEEERAYEEIDQIQNILGLAAQFFQTNMNDNVTQYLKSRDINDEVTQAFGMGYAPGSKSLTAYLEKNKIPLMMMSKAGLVSKGEDGRPYEVFRDRLMFPIKNIYGKVIGFGGRTMSDAMPKYLNSPETIVFKKNETLYGENTAMGAAYRKGQMIVVEGYMDTIALQKNGFENCVASLGTAVTVNHIAKLWRSVDEIIMCLDGDEAGIRASSKVVDLVLPQVSYIKKVSFVILPKSMDPDEILQKRGRQYFEQVLEKRLSLSEMIWYLETRAGVGASAEARANLEHRLENTTQIVADPVLRRNYSRFFKDQSWKYFSGGKRVLGHSDMELPTNLNESELIEHSIFSLLVKIPDLLSDMYVQETLSRLALESEILCAFRSYLLEISESLTPESLKVLVEKTRFAQLFVLLSAPSAIFLNISNIDKEYNHKLLWEMLIKKHSLLRSKLEYVVLLNSMDDGAFAKARVYQQEIIKTQQDIDKISESLIESGDNGRYI